MRRYASVPGVTGSWIAMSWSKRERGPAAAARASCGATRAFVPRRSTITIWLPRPFILRKRRFASALTAILGGGSGILGGFRRYMGQNRRFRESRADMRRCHDPDPMDAVRGADNGARGGVLGPCPDGAGDRRSP